MTTTPVQPESAAGFGDHRLQIEKAIGDVERHHSFGLEVALVNSEGFPRQQMNRNRVAAERVEHENVEPFIGQTFQHQSSVADKNPR